MPRGSRSFLDVCANVLRLHLTMQDRAGCLCFEGEIRKGMISPTHVAIVLIGTILFAGACDGGFDPAKAGSIPAPSEEAVPPPADTQPAIEPHGRAYLFRGALGPIFSRGMDHLTERIEQAGIPADVYEFTICRLIAEKAIREYRQDPAPIILIGHSMGGLCAVMLAEILQAVHIPVSLVVTIDPAHATPEVPLNVERYINIFLAKTVLGGGDVRAVPGFQGHYASFDVSQLKEVLHINIDKLDSIHEQLVAKIVQLATTPAKVDGEAVPLRYVVPPGAAIELWDSGVPVFARPGDTLQTIAALHHVPLWSLTQMNKGADTTPLVPGERIIVPRHLVPLAEISGRLPPAR
jgi:pimeloyl-ACP methyl ester carboxylesterase